MSLIVSLQNKNKCCNNLFVGGLSRVRSHQD